MQTNAKWVGPSITTMAIGVALSIRWLEVAGMALMALQWISSRWQVVIAISIGGKWERCRCGNVPTCNDAVR